MKCRYDPKYVSQYKSKHTKHVKLSKKVRFPLDTQKEYLNREWPHLVSPILIILLDTNYKLRYFVTDIEC
jgi:hypothetical protein